MSKRNLPMKSPLSKLAIKIMKNHSTPQEPFLPVKSRNNSSLFKTKLMKRKIPYKNIPPSSPDQTIFILLINHLNKNNHKNYLKKNNHKNNHLIWIKKKKKMLINQKMFINKSMLKIQSDSNQPKSKRNNQNFLKVKQFMH